MLKYVVTSAPSVEPVSAAELKLQTKVDHTAEDTLLASYIKTARTMVEEWTGRALITQTRKAYDDEIRWEYELPGAPLQSVTSFKIYDYDGTAHAVDSSGYELDEIEGEIYVKPDAVLPQVILKTVNPVEIIYVCGYGATSASVPEPLRQAILLLAAHFYEHREAVTLGNTAAVVTAPIALGVDSLIEPYRVHQL